MNARRRVHGEDGASLIIALGFLAMFGLLIPAIVGLGATSFLGTNRLASQRSIHYAADGALDGAIQFLQQPSVIEAGCGVRGVYSAANAACRFTTDIDGKVMTVDTKGIGALGASDRTVELHAKKMGSSTDIAAATVIIRDHIAVPPGTPEGVDVQSWKYKRS